MRIGKRGVEKERQIQRELCSEVLECNKAGTVIEITKTSEQTVYPPCLIRHSGD